MDHALNFIEVRETDRVIYNYEFREGFLNGYIFDARPKGHTHCQCMRSKTLQFFLPHHRSFGTWPVHYRAMTFLANRLEVSVDVTVLAGGSSYGLYKSRPVAATCGSNRRFN